MTHWNAGQRAAPTADASNVALIQASDLAQLRADLAAAQADAAQWRQRVLDTRELLALVEDLAADPTPAAVGALVNYFTAWRALVEARVPVTWAEAQPEPGEPEPEPWPDPDVARALGAAQGGDGAFDEWEEPRTRLT